MNPIRYQIESFNENYDNLNSAKGGYCKPLVFLDYIGSAIRHGASAADYFSYEFFNITNRKRREFVCWRLKKRFFRKMNDYSKSHVFNNKALFLKTFDRYVKREWLYAPEATDSQLTAFCDRHEWAMVKPVAASCGKGVERVSTRELRAQFDRLRAEKLLVEELIVQHPEMDRLCPTAINTIRVATVNRSGTVEILGAAMRCGRGGGCIDNFCAGGILMRIDQDSGTVISDGVNQKHERWLRAPDTGVLLHGFQVPHWDKVLETVREAALVVPGVNYTGWDIAVRQDDVCLVEGNFEGMLYGFRGIKDRVLEIMKD